MIFTTSWDDGYHLDLRVADLLEKNGCKGTFYICPKQRQRKLLSPDDIKALSQHHEIGAHTLSHPRLTSLSDDEAKKEIIESKLWVEELTKKSCEMFCYPYGNVNNRIRNIVKQSGFKGARTTQGFQFTSSDPFLLATSLQVSPFPYRIGKAKFWHFLDPLGPLRVKAPNLMRLGINPLSCTSWIILAKKLFDHAIEKNHPWFHVWGHSSELEKFNMWEDLEVFLKYVRNKKDITHQSNSALLS